MFEDKTVDSSEIRHPPVEVGSLSVCLISVFASFYTSGQIIATSHDLTPNGGLVLEIPLYFREI